MEKRQIGIAREMQIVEEKIEKIRLTWERGQIGNKEKAAAELGDCFAEPTTEQINAFRKANTKFILPAVIGRSFVTEVETTPDLEPEEVRKRLLSVVWRAVESVVKQDSVELSPAEREELRGISKITNREHSSFNDIG
jgi:hypothetical protein